MEKGTKWDRLWRRIVHCDFEISTRLSVEPTKDDIHLWNVASKQYVIIVIDSLLSIHSISSFSRLLYLYLFDLLSSFLLRDCYTLNACNIMQCIDWTIEWNFLSVMFSFTHTHTHTLSLSFRYHFRSMKAVYPNGEVCISILHTGEDPTHYENITERWSPIQTIEKILLSVVSMLAGLFSTLPLSIWKHQQKIQIQLYSTKWNSFFSSLEPNDESPANVDAAVSILYRTVP